MFQDLELQFDELRADDDAAALDERQIVPNDDEILANLDKDTKNATGKRRIMRPRLKLDPERLCGPRGIEIIPKLFEDFKIRGKGREFDDLNEAMNKLEHWAHRLFPQMPFDEILARLENLGSKRLVQNTLGKIRYDDAMPTSADNSGAIGIEFEENNETANLFFDEFSKTNDAAAEPFLNKDNNECATDQTLFDDFLNDDVDDLIAVNIN